MKKLLPKGLREFWHEVVDLRPIRLVLKDDYPDYLVPRARPVARGKVKQNAAICGIGVCVRRC